MRNHDVLEYCSNTEGIRTHGINKFIILSLFDVIYLHPCDIFTSIDEDPVLCIKYCTSPNRKLVHNVKKATSTKHHKMPHNGQIIIKYVVYISHANFNDIY